MSTINNHLVIMAGGVGSRFWPMSTPDYPKQFIDVLGCGRTLIQLTMDRFKGIVPEENGISCAVSTSLIPCPNAPNRPSCVI